MNFLSFLSLRAIYGRPGAYLLDLASGLDAAPAETAAGLNNNVPENIGSLLNSDANNLNSGGNPAWMIGYYFVIILALVAVLFLLRKYLLKRVKGFNAGNGNRMRVSDKIIISPDKQIMMVELSGKMMVVGVTNQTISQLALLDKGECAEFIENDAAESPFGNILAERIGFLKDKKRSGAVKNDLTDVNNKDE